jgi:hypothetical protein
LARNVFPANNEFLPLCAFFGPISSRIFPPLMMCLLLSICEILSHSIRAQTYAHHEAGALRVWTLGWPMISYTWWNKALADHPVNRQG